MEFKRTCEAINLPFEFLIVDRHADGGKAGCFNSHQIVAQKALDAGAKNALIFEDDARLFDSRLTASKFIRLQEELEKEEWELVYFGHMPMMFSRIKQITSGSCLARCSSSWMSHSYFVSESFLHKIVNEKYNDEHYDHFLHRISEAEKRYVVYPMMFYQDDRPGCVSPTWLLAATTSIAGAATMTETMAYQPGYSMICIIVWVLIIIIIVWLLNNLFRWVKSHSDAR